MFVTELSAHPVDVGTRSETILLAEFVKRGYEVLLPWSVNCRYDMALDLGSRVLKVQCKTARLECGTVAFTAQSVRSNSEGWHTRRYDGEVDLFGVYCPPLDRCFVIPAEDVTTNGVRLRIRPAANGQQKRVRWAADYDIARLAQLVRARGLYPRDAGSTPAAGFSEKPWSPPPECCIVPSKLIWSRQRVVDAMATWLKQLPPGAPRTQKAYRLWSTGQPSRPAQSTVGRYGGFAEVRAAAERLLQRETER